MSALPSGPALSDVSVVTAIKRRADAYMDQLEQARNQGALRTREAELLDTFESYTADVLDRYAPPGRRTGESLVFASIYKAWDPDLPEDERLRRLITALMAADVESRGPLRLTRAQNTRLAAIFEHIGAECLAENLPLHAELAFDHAAGIYLLLGNNTVRDRCLHERTRSRQLAKDRSWGKLWLWLAWVLCGYGYKPFRLLIWVAVQLAVFSVGHYLATSDPLIESVYVCLINYLDPRDSASDVARWLLVVESYASLVTLSVFFALLVHRWFRI